MFAFLDLEEDVAQTLAQVDSALCGTDELPVGQVDFGVGGLDYYNSFYNTGL